MGLVWVWSLVAALMVAEAWGLAMALLWGLVAAVMGVLVWTWAERVLSAP